MEKSKQHDKTKDRLLDNCSESIKQLQIEVCQMPDTIFIGNMWQVDELCTRMNSTLSYGLKRSANGYWLFFRDLSHKSVVKTIEGLSNVNSNLDKGYAWLQLAINDHALESYLRLAMSNQNAAKSMYLPHAILRDSQRLHLLIMLVSGLEHLPFRLDWNDTLNCKRSSIVTLSTESGCDSDVEEAECASFCTDSLSSPFEESRSYGMDDDEDDPEIGIITMVTFDPETGTPIKFSDENSVVHSSVRMTRRRKKERLLNNNINILEEENSAPISDLCDSNPRVSTPEREKFLESILNNETNIFAKEKSVSDNLKELSVRSLVSGNESSVYDSAPISTPDTNLLNTSLSVKLQTKVVEEIQARAMKTKLMPEPMMDLSERGVPEGQEDPMTTSVNSTNKKLTALLEKNRLDDSWLPVSPVSKINKSVVKVSSEQLKAEIDSEITAGKQQKKEQQAGEIELNNNFLLMIMLEVVVDQEEKVYKVYRGMTGHTVGSPLEINVVLTDQRLYLIHWNNRENKLVVDSSVTHAEIEYVQFGLNAQFLNIVCASPRRRFWVSTGDEEITRNIVSSLEVSIRRNPRILDSALPSVYTQATMQTIAARKWVTKQIGLDTPESVIINHYALVRWEDPHVALSNSNSPAGPSKEGFLMYAYVGSKAAFGNETQWKPAYFRLKAGVFYHFNDSLDTTFRNYIQLVNGECVGCRHLHNSPRPHTFEILMAHDRALRLAAASEEEASLWLQIILQSVSQGYLGEEVKNPWISACVIFAAGHLFICHEQLETNTFSLLSTAQLLDVAAIHVDLSSGSSYCIVEFESVEATESNGDWVLYFASENELAKFISVVKSTWSDLYKVPLSVNSTLDPVFQKRFYNSQNFYACDTPMILSN